MNTRIVYLRVRMCVCVCVYSGTFTCIICCIRTACAVVLYTHRSGATIISIRRHRCNCIVYHVKRVRFPKRMRCTTRTRNPFSAAREMVRNRLRRIPYVDNTVGQTVFVQQSSDMHILAPNEYFILVRFRSIRYVCFVRRKYTDVNQFVTW